ncbi:MAG: hypothetical protein A4S14_01960 [Proteobacteria bacterium SG_bin9]|nr:MAG: hypothetical protein A4S14_01960 [Proteobacteria bacterium SG_bin9]
MPFPTRTALFALAGILATTAAAPAMAEGPAISTKWLDLTVTQDVCLSKAEAAIKIAGFDNPEKTQQSRYGTIDGYTGAVRCISDKAIVMFVVSGPNRGTAERASMELFKAFVGREAMAR